MADQTAGQGITSRSDAARTADRVPARAWRTLVRHKAVLGLTAVLLGAFAHYCYWNEGSTANVMFVLSVAALVLTTLMLVTRRILVSTIIVTALAGIIVAASTVKVELMHMAVHAYDVVYYLSSPATLTFLVAKYPLVMAQLFGALGALAAITYLSHRIDETRVPRLYSAVGIVCLALLTAAAAKSKDARAAWRLFEDGLALTKFLGSWPETIDTIWRGQLVEAAAGPSGAPLSVPQSCHPEKKPPHVILIHQESVVPPEYFPALEYDKAMDPMFRSGDGALYKLRVETYAGASWLTEFSILAGVSTYSFGSMRPFVQALMAGKVHDTLPEAFTRCGYRNVVFYPLDKNFVGNGRFYEAVGMGEIIDRKAQGASTSWERDAFHYDNLLKLIGAHVRTSSQPLFSFLLTIATHQPYDTPFKPELDVRGGGPGTEPGMNEFLRRLSMARIDLEAFEKELARRFPSEQFLIVHYGDHQPTTTWHYVSADDQAAILSGAR